MLTNYQKEIIDNTEHLGTNKYNPIITSDVINTFKEQGFSISSMEQSNYRKAEKYAKTKHMLRMKLNDDIGQPVQREIVIFNSHDRSTSLRLNFGIFRLVCSNTMVLGDNLVEEMRIKHTSLNPFQRIEQYAKQVKGALEEEAELRRAMRAKKLSWYDIMELSREAMTIREEDLGIVLDPSELNIVRRIEDNGKDLWHTFNRVQEALVKGLYKKEGTTTNEEGKEVKVFKKAKELKAPAELIRVNKELHTLYSGRL